MIITIHNYPEFFVRAADGDLSPAEQILLEEFLEQYPDLTYEFESYRDALSVGTEHIAVPDFTHLRKNIIPVSGIDEDTYTEFFVAAFEGDLNKDEQAQLEEFVRKNPSLKKEFDLTGKARVQTDTNIIYPKRKELKRTDRVPLYTLASAVAASVLCVIVFNNTNGDSNMQAHRTMPMPEIERPVLHQTSPELNIRKHAGTSQRKQLDSVPYEGTVSKRNSQKLLDSPTLAEVTIPVEEYIFHLPSRLTRSTVEANSESEYLTPVEWAVEQIEMPMNEKVLSESIQKRNKIRFFDVFRFGAALANRVSNKELIRADEDSSGRRTVRIQNSFFEIAYSGQSSQSRP